MMLNQNPKQNRDPNRSTRQFGNRMDKKLSSQHNHSSYHHNNSLNLISSTQPYLPASKMNKNSQILAQIKQSKNNLRNNKQNQNTKTNLSTTRTNYKPKFILKDLMQQEKLLNHYQNINYQIDNSSQCQQYEIMKKNKQNNKISHNLSSHLSNTFNNSPLGSSSQAYYRRLNNSKDLKGKINIKQIDQNIYAKNKSVILSKRTYLEDQSKRNDDNQNQKTKQYDLPVQIKYLNKSNIPINKNMKSINTQSHRQTQSHLQQEKQSSFLQSDSNFAQVYQQASTVQYPKKLFSNKNNKQQKDSLNFEPRVRSISTQNYGQYQKNENIQKNYKISYLQTKKQLQIRSAYFNEAMSLCQDIIGKMKQALQKQYQQNQSQKIIWCHQRCEDLLQVLQQWNEQKHDRK